MSEIITPLWPEHTACWVWPEAPGAIRHVGEHDKTYVSWIDNTGKAHVSSYDHATEEYVKTEVHDWADPSDHGRPSILVRDSDSRVIVFISGHNKNNVYFRISTNPEDVSEFGELKEISLIGERYAYTAPVELTTEGKIYVFFRRSTLEGEPGVRAWGFAVSTDNGETFIENSDALLSQDGVYSPYTRPISNGTDTIWFARSDWKDGRSSWVREHLMAFYYNDDAFYQLDGTEICKFTDLPITDRTQLDLVYDSDGDDWCFVSDIKLDQEGRPVVGFHTLDRGTSETEYNGTGMNTHRYAWWDGTSWNHSIVTDAGGDITEVDTHPHYFAGLNLDSLDANRMVVGVETELGSKQFNIEVWSTVDKQDWSLEKTITGLWAEKPDKVFRPNFIRNRHDEYEMVFLGGEYNYFDDYESNLYRTGGEGHWVVDFNYWRSIDAKATAVDADQENRPTVLILTAPELATVANGGHIENTDATGGASGALTVPADFEVRTDFSDPLTVLNFEFVDYDPVTGYIELWVNIDNLSSTSDTTIWLMYGNSDYTVSRETISATWVNNFEAVWHLGESLADSRADNDGTNQGTSNATGQVGDGQEFVHVNEEYIDVGTMGDLGSTLSETRTIEFWLRVDPGRPDEYINVLGQLEDSVAEALYINVNRDVDENYAPGYLHFMCRDTTGTLRWATTSDVGVDDGAWHHVAIVMYPWQSPSTAQTFVDGVEVAISYHGQSTLGSNNNLTYPLWIGNINVRGAGASGWYDGILDEIFFSPTGRTASWITTSYNNQSDPEPDGTFWGVLGEEQGEIEWQRLRPIFDAHVGNWTTHLGATTDLYDVINEEQANDDEYVQSEESPDNSPVVFKLDSGIDPNTLENHEMSYRYRKSGGNIIDLTVELREGYVDENNLGTLIASWVHEDISTTVLQADQSLTIEEADTIADYSDLYLRLIGNEIE